MDQGPDHEPAERTHQPQPIDLASWVTRGPVDEQWRVSCPRIHGAILPDLGQGKSILWGDSLWSLLFIPSLCDRPADRVGATGGGGG
jgi:hypothetical protein